MCYEERKETLKALGLAKTTNREEDLRNYARKRKRYKATIKEAREKFIEEEARNMAEEAERNPFLPIKKRSKQTMKEIPIQTWEKHFAGILNKSNKRVAFERTQKKDKTTGSKIKITEEEVDRCIRASKNKKQQDRTR